MSTWSGHQCVPNTRLLQHCVDVDPATGLCKECAVQVVLNAATPLVKTDYYLHLGLCIPEGKYFLVATVPDAINNNIAAINGIGSDPEFENCL